MEMNVPKSHKSIAATLIAPMLFCASFLICIPANQVRAQEKVAVVSGDRERGIELYRKGDLNGAIEALNAAVKKEKRDADAWHFLGLAYYGYGDGKNARKAFEAEAKLRPDSAAAHIGLAYSLLLNNKFSMAALEAERALALDAKNADAHYVLGVRYFRDGARAKALGEAEKAIKLNPNFAPAYLLKIQILLGTYEWAIIYYPNESEEARASRLKEARNSLETYLKLYPLTPNPEMLQETMESLNGYLKPKNERETTSQSEPVAFPPQEVIQKARILSKPPPEFTDMASQMGVGGTVVIRAVFGSDGRIKNIRVIEPLPHGLTETAIRAARRIKFQPAIKNGRPASQYVQIEYNFLR